MKLRTKAILFGGMLLLALSLTIIFYAEYIVGDAFKMVAKSNLRIIAEQSESIYFTFLENVGTGPLDWTSDSKIQALTKDLLATGKGTPERTRLAKEFGAYVNEKKMPFRKTIFLTDLLDKDGIVIASTRESRIGNNEAKEETLKKANDFSKAIVSKFGEVFVKSFVFEEDEGPEPMIHATIRLFTYGNDGVWKPLDAVLLVHFVNTKQLAAALGANTGIQTNRFTSTTLLKSYDSSDIYLVNKDKLMVTHSRYALDIKQRQKKIDTLPVRECFENGKEISTEYDNYRDVRVIGASMCIASEGIVLVVEINKDEILAPATKLVNSTIFFGMLLLFLGIFTIVLVARKPLAVISNVVLVAKRVEKGDLDAQVEVKTKDELGYLAASFNTMIVSIRNTQKNLRISKNKADKERVKAEALIAGMGEGIIATDNTGKIITVNHAAEKLLGWKKDELAGKQMTEIIPGLDENDKIIPQEKRSISVTLITGKETPIIARQYVGKDGKCIPVSGIINPIILDNKLIGAIAVFRDTTRENEIEKMRRDILSLASHQLRTPLSGTKWLIETLKKGIHGTLTKNQEEYLDQIYKINERMTALVHDMLSVLRIESDTAQDKKERVSSATLFDALFETLNGALKGKHITLQLKKTGKYMIESNRIILQTILENLVSNAIAYSPNESEVVVNIEKNPTEFIFTVKDSGIGIPKDEQQQIFQRFYRASNAKTADTRGTGLGLYIAATLAKKIGASISFESEEGKGATFYVHIPHPAAEVLPENATSV